MKVQTCLSPAGRKSWIVIDDDYRPIRPVSAYLRFLGNLDRSPYTIRCRAFHLKEYWCYLTQKGLAWEFVTLEQLAEYISWLKVSGSKSHSQTPDQSVRTASTINVMLSTLYSFYEFHQKNSGIQGIDGYTQQLMRKICFRPLLSGINRPRQETSTRLLKLKEPKSFPGCLSCSDVKRLIDACHLHRDQFLISLFYESGIRLGEALGLRHSDIHSSGQNEIAICPRVDNINGARAKNLRSRTVHVSKALLQLYSTYLVEEYPDQVDCDYVFVNVKREPIGMPLKPQAVYDLFSRLKQTTGIAATPHLFRHTHATELIRDDWDMSHVQKRLGHASVQTTVNTYVHLTDRDLKQAYQSFIEGRANETH